MQSRGPGWGAGAGFCCCEVWVDKQPWGGCPALSQRVDGGAEHRGAGHRGAGRGRRTGVQDGAPYDCDLLQGDQRGSRDPCL